MNESYVTLQGWVGNDVDAREVSGVPMASLRVACTPRFNRGGSWVDGETAWYTVNCWRQLGQNVAASIQKGDAIVVHGRVRVDVWEREGQPPSVAWIVDATFVGHDLTKGTSEFTKTPRSERLDPAQDESVKELVHGYSAGGPKVDSLGEGVEPAA
jgi:single-strand DNA-binding protein